MIKNILNIFFNNKKKLTNNTNKMSEIIEDVIGHWVEKFGSSGKSKNIINVYGWSSVDENYVVIGRQPRGFELDTEITLHKHELFSRYEKILVGVLSEKPKNLKLPKNLLMGLDDYSPPPSTPTAIKENTETLNLVNIETHNQPKISPVEETKESLSYTSENVKPIIKNLEQKDNETIFHETLIQKFKTDEPKTTQIELSIVSNYDFTRLRDSIELLGLDKKVLIGVLLNDENFRNSLVGLLDKPLTEEQIIINEHVENKVLSLQERINKLNV